jgi:hypothetical protein
VATYGQLDRKYLDLIWDSSQVRLGFVCLTLKGKHESIINIIYASINDLASVLSIEDLDYIFDKIKTIPLSQYDQQLLYLVRGISIHAINYTLNVSFFASLTKAISGKEKNVVWIGDILGSSSRRNSSIE